jgi:riboflavin kinase/FMN adenylyltransferase
VLRGRVIPGADRGKDLGFPTANLDIQPEALPPAGIYAAWVRINGERQWRPAAASIGVNPTFGESVKKLEVHLLDFSADLYGKTLEVLPAAYLRPEKRFETVAALIRQMRQDCRRAAALLARTGPPDSDPFSPGSGTSASPGSSGPGSPDSAATGSP